MFWGLYPVYWGLKSRTWLQTRGTIVRSRVKKVMTRRGNQYNAEVRYKYRPTRRELQGSRICFNFAGHGFMTEGGARKCIMPYQRGAYVTVYYDPSDPRKAVLEPGLHSSLFMTVFLVATGILMLGASALIVWAKFYSDM